MDEGTNRSGDVIVVPAPEASIGLWQIKVEGKDESTMVRAPTIADIHPRIHLLLVYFLQPSLVYIR